MGCAWRAEDNIPSPGPLQGWIRQVKTLGMLSYLAHESPRVLVSQPHLSVGEL